MSNVIHIVRYNGNKIIVSNDPQELIELIDYDVRMNNVYQLAFEKLLNTQRDFVLSRTHDVRDLPKSQAKDIGVSLVTTMPIQASAPLVYLVFSPTSVDPLIIDDPELIGIIPDVRDNLRHIADSIRSAIEQGRTPKCGSNVQPFELTGVGNGTALLTVVHAKAFGEHVGSMKIDYDDILRKYKRDHQ